MSALKVVRIVTPVIQGSPDGFTEINETDYDPEKHELWPPKPKTDPLTVEQIKEKLVAAKIAFAATAKKEELEKLLAEHLAKD